MFDGGWRIWNVFVTLSGVEGWMADGGWCMWKLFVTLSGVEGWNGGIGIWDLSLRVTPNPVGAKCE